MYGHLKEECRKKKQPRQEWRVVDSNRQDKEVGVEQHNQQAEFVTPRRTTRRSSSKERERLQNLQQTPSRHCWRMK